MKLVMIRSIALGIGLLGLAGCGKDDNKATPAAGPAPQPTVGALSGDAWTSISEQLDCSAIRSIPHNTLPLPTPVPAPGPAVPAPSPVTPAPALPSPIAPSNPAPAPSFNMLACANGRMQFTVDHDGNFSILNGGSGRLAPQELSRLSQAITALSNQDLTANATCVNLPADRGIPNEQITLSLQNHSQVTVWNTDNQNNHSCTVGDAAHARQLHNAMAPLIQQYAPVPPANGSNGSNTGGVSGGPDHS